VSTLSFYLRLDEILMSGDELVFKTKVARRNVAVGSICAAVLYITAIVCTIVFTDWGGPEVITWFFFIPLICLLGFVLAGVLAVGCWIGVTDWIDKGE
jgi:hypothetical protein